MKKKEVIDKIRACFKTELPHFQSNVVSDEVQFTLKTENYLGFIGIRCQSFGSKFSLNPSGNSISIFKIEESFRNLLHESILPKYGEDTLGISPNFKEEIKEIRNFSFTDLSALDEYLPKLKRFLEQVEQEFLIPFSDVNYIAKYIAQYSYADHLQVLVGGQFPIPILKKIFILHIGNQKEVCEQYTKGLKNTIDTYKERYPEKADKVPILKESYAFFIKRLEEIGL
jgi:hypothetical protein